MIYPRNGKEIVVPVYVIGDTSVTGTLFSRYMGDILEGSRLRAYELKTKSSLVSMPAGDVSDSRLPKTYINPSLITKFGSAKLIDVPADIKEIIDEAYAIEDKENKTESDLENLKNDKEKLSYYFSATRAYSI